ncbi:PepSY-associated TM helix domain-containing protein [Variovorax saccharolyticus]|uniref:PepSY-associated TM helix domain-containing protein n=1 Tax=Variovorax saccharolyticus TaxID=3053516 RepID=UPI002574FA47|nr:PepSY-associated TM helix domain-containing protein [Variovorax sp. J22R187]MDM0016553.1 PepSY-associated TM helix domain-containing protein [Variovorax sp. J22R187]
MTAATTDNRRRAYWLKTLHEWHWVSSALCLIGLLLFGVTGFTLNHAASIEAKPKVTSRTASVDDALRAALQKQVAAAKAQKGKAELPAELQQWIRNQWDIDTGGREAEWTDDEIYLSLPRPGGDAWLRLSLIDGEAEYERTDRGWLSYFNDLHKGRNSGAAWSWFIDIFAAATLVFSITGLFILKMHAGNRPFTWPMVGMGLVIPVLLALLFIH